jgi:hypothetical protein
MLNTKAVALLLTFVLSAFAQQYISERIFVKTKDGVSLFTHIDRPNITTPVKTLLERTPYGCPDTVNYYWLSMGMAYVCQEFRGRLRSNGTFSLFELEWSDAEDIIVYITNQTWSNQDIRSFGYSAPSIAAYMEGISPISRKVHIDFIIL